jgi:co-chaperonin GroES (HSP10)
MKAFRTEGGLILPSKGIDPQGYGKVLSCGTIIENETNIKVGDYLVFHPGAGMDIAMKKQIMKVVKFEEIYGLLEDQEIIDTLEAIQVGGNTEGETIIKPAGGLL